jgi:hypothetical protein
MEHLTDMLYIAIAGVDDASIEAKALALQVAQFLDDKDIQLCKRRALKRIRKDRLDGTLE